ncbi:hypothetical protein N8935_01080 [Amylibacter sp.]|nr:hypothetical protein [Amylibacter sp.]
MKKLLLASASVLTLISACTKEVEVADRAGILQKFSGSDDEVQDIGIERLTTTLPQDLGGRTIVANVMREGISEELPEEFIGGYVYGIAGDILDGDAIEYGDGEGFFVDGDAVDNNGAIYVSGTGEDMVGVGIIVGMEAEDSLMIIAAGTEVSAMPTTGKYDYEGENFAIGFSESDDDIDEHIGSFNAGVNFETGEGSINLEFDNELLYIDGDFTVDTATGIFVGDELDMNSIGGTFGTATIHGNFHGEGASGMTGIYTNNIADPDFIGAIAGHQQDSPPPVLPDPRPILVVN